MLLGHYGVAFAAKRAAPRTSLGTLSLAAWRSIPLTIGIELAVFVPGLVTYLRTTRARDRVGSWALRAMVLALLAIFFGGFASPPPADGRAVAMGALGLWLFVPWGWWVDRHREVVRTSAGGA